MSIRSSVMRNRVNGKRGSGGGGRHAATGGHGRRGTSVWVRGGAARGERTDIRSGVATHIARRVDIGRGGRLMRELRISAVIHMVLTLERCMDLARSASRRGRNMVAHDLG